MNSDRANPIPSRVPAARNHSYFRKIAALLLVLVVSCLPVQSQQQQPRNPSAGPSDLASENLSRVAASAAQIEEVLRKELGLLVELKRWVAKEATDRGQIVEDADLTDRAIFDRLTRDQQFRAVATRLLQRYGYLLPKLNPDSELAQEQFLLLKERVRRMEKANAEEEATAKQRTTERSPERAITCDPRRDKDCVEEEQPRQAGKRQQDYDNRLAPEVAPPELPQQTLPRQSPRNPLEDPEMRRPVIQTVAEPGLGPTSPLAQRPTESLAPAGSLDLSITDTRSARAPEREDLAAASQRMPERQRGLRPRSTVGQRLERGEREEKEEEPGALAMIHRPNPYADIPSLYDMYVQASARQPKLERFGQEVFRNGTRDSELIPMDLPVGPDYVVGPGDGLAIDLWGGVTQRLLRVVDREGRVSLPEAGPVLVSGRTLGEVQQAVQQILRTQFRDVSADISLSRLRTIRVYVVGDVDQPGAYDISSLSTPLNALFAAGGPTSRGSLRALKQFRGKQLVQEVDAYDLLLRGVRSDLKRLESGDTLLVSPMGPQVTVEGMVRRPAVYELRGEKTLAEVLELAGGILPTATLRHIEVQRVEEHQKHTMLNLDISQPEDSETITKQLESFAIRDGDEVHIFPIAPYNQDAVFVQGHVLRPGRYSFHPGMKLTDVISSYADLLPEPATKYAEIVRLNPPDFRPSVESFDLAAALENPVAAPKIQPLDTVRIFSRYDFENPPTVSVWGEVRSPGSYRATGQIHFRDALQLAGGVTPDALLDNAQVYRYLSDSKLKILSVDLAQALAGNPIDNILLEPRDRVLVHRNLAKVDPPSVFVKGEVAKPGRYPLTTNLRVEDLIRLAGGLKRSAYPESADLTRYLSQDSKRQTGEHLEINIAAALAGDPNHDVPLHDGDVLTIRQVPGWNDIGASVTVRGEVQHPGVYGIQAGERLSSVLQRAGGFSGEAYPYGAVVTRREVREIEEKSYAELIRRVQAEQTSLKLLPETDADQKTAKQAALLQSQSTLDQLKTNPPVGRLVIHITPEIKNWRGAAADVAVRDGDVLLIPKKPNFVMVTGQVYNPTAISYRSGRSAKWYLSQAGGLTQLANKKGAFVIRADGSVISSKGTAEWWAGNPLGAVLRPGDTIVVPEKAIGAPTRAWASILQTAQIASSIAFSAVVVATR